MKMRVQAAILSLPLCFVAASPLHAQARPQRPAAVGATLEPQAEASFDTDRHLLLEDTDGDRYPDLTESLERTNPLDPKSYPGSQQEVTSEEMTDAERFGADFPVPFCRAGFQQAGARLCISTNLLNAESFANAMVICRDRFARVASYGDLRYLYLRSSLDAAYDPNGRWIGDFVGDDRALCGNASVTFDNDPDIGNFEGECSRFDLRSFWCAHDRE
jgi:hypothetical protein